MRNFLVGMLACTIFCTLAMTALAAAPRFLSPERQYEILPMEGDPEVEQTYYGELKGDPHMYEMVAAKPFVLTVALAQAPFGSSTLPLSYIIVEALVTGKVVEVGRVEPSLVGWHEERDNVLGIRFLTAQTFSQELPAGTYRIEVSAPENMGKYRLTTGTKETNIGYFGTWQELFAANNFFNRSVFALLTSFFVQMQLLLVAGGLLVWKYAYPWWKRRQQTRHA